MFGLSYDHPGRNTEEYVRILSALLDGESVDFEGADWTAHTGGRAVRPTHRVPVLVSPLGPRLLRVAGQFSDGAVLWMALARAIRPTCAQATGRGEGGRPSESRIVAGLPVAVHDDEAEARAAAATYSSAYAGMVNYQRILDIGEAASPAEAAIVGDENAVRGRFRSLHERVRRISGPRLPGRGT